MHSITSSAHDTTLQQHFVEFSLSMPRLGNYIKMRHHRHISGRKLWCNEIVSFVLEGKDVCKCIKFRSMYRLLFRVVIFHGISCNSCASFTEDAPQKTPRFTVNVNVNTMTSHRRRCWLVGTDGPCVIWTTCTRSYKRLYRVHGVSELIISMQWLWDCLHECIQGGIWKRAKSCL